MQGWHVHWLSPSHHRRVSGGDPCTGVPRGGLSHPQTIVFSPMRFDLDQSQRDPWRDRFAAFSDPSRTMADITVQMLAPDQIRSVYPLIRQAVPALDLPGWQRFARGLVHPRRPELGGIVVATRLPRPFPCGLFCYRQERDLTHGKVLIGEHFVALDLLEPDIVLAALVAELDALAKRFGCDAVRSVVHGSAPDVASGLAAAGHRPEASLLWKPIPPATVRDVATLPPG